MAPTGRTNPMTAQIRTLLFLTITTILVAACGTSAGSSTSQTPDPTQPTYPSVEPSEVPAESPADEREVAGTITVAEGITFSGPGVTVQEALDAGGSGDSPSLVNGVLFLDTDGTIYLATSVSDVAVPTFDGPMLEVLNMDNTGDSWDMANAELLGLEEANGIVFHQDAQVLGFLDER
jgi:hypothetical protein